MITPKENLQLYGPEEPGHAGAMDMCIEDLYARLEKLELGKLPKCQGPDIHIGDFLNLPKFEKPDVHDCKGSPDIPERFRAGAPIPEGHPIPDYDFSKELDIAIEAMQEADKEVDKLNEAIFINATLEWLAHREKWDNEMSEKKMREWGQRDYLLYEIMKEASEPLT